MSTNRTTATPLEAISISAICFGYVAVQSVQAMAAGFPIRSFTDERFVGLAIWEILMASAALALLYYRGFSLTSLIPLPAFKGCLVGVAL